MSRSDQEANIDCPLGIFSAHERVVRQLSEAINRAAAGPAKIKAATDLQERTLELLSCDGEAGNVNCTLCREFSRLRNQMAALVIDASRLAR